ncbi:glutamine amidotransferase [Mycobacterium sherrisii]|uniref:Glutamine amidotransferase n=1 Tax=Mycobacterium sherrisii TaxID=243061 RepID=A0A1E3SU79_9MYCO|nr:glutamine amidotransferase [Mycobacterium sherrisii]MCV7029183.1 glutamine amidotransferase [Mycobacterium sherrisii]MEC4763296.1 glutamine amidotransferase [Mycobacterium sherrisii]ODR05701.1 glutamine amidotransferase [Mycobacterium sherrisii]ORW76983.1 glutamine amidotransferase [Mycobacterium sherrisii]
MCGIIGLHLRNPDLYARLGALLAVMLGEMEDRGADSAGVAVYGDPAWSPSGQGCVSLIGVTRDASSAAAEVGAELGRPVDAVFVADTLLLRGAAPPSAVLEAARAVFADAVIAGFGQDFAVLKGVGRPRDLVQRWGLTAAQGWQGVGHTRMATESAVNPSGCHPYAVGPNQCLVHNGSFANHASIRRDLQRGGVHFDSENDSEVGARFVAQQLADGRDIETALKALCASFDGFYTLLVSDRNSFAVVRDAIACKPAVIAETDDWVAMASEYRALAQLPGVERARVWEPQPEVVYAWTR